MYDGFAYFDQGIYFLLSNLMTSMTLIFGVKGKRIKINLSLDLTFKVFSFIKLDFFVRRKNVKWQNLLIDMCSRPCNIKLIEYLI